jgi:hypothetical protein
VTELTAEHLRSILYYDPSTGVMTWRVRVADSVRVGDQAGHIDDKGYVRISIGNRQRRAHRLAWFYVTGEWPKGSIDHKDTNRANNAWSNLRLATNSQNGSNTAKYRTNTSGFKGVSRRANGRFLASIQHRKRKLHIGVYDTPEEAHAAYCRKAAELHGEYARPA